MSEKQNIKKVVILAALFITSFLVMCFIYDQIQYSYGPVFFEQIDETVPMAFFSLIAASLITACVSFIAFNTRFHVSLVYTVIILYTLILLYVLFAKSIGTSGVNLNPFDAEVASIGFALNSLIFIPAGFILQFHFKNSIKAILTGFAIIVIVEFCQYAFSLGVADIVDVIANMIGVCIGVFSLNTLTHFGRCIAKQNSKIFLSYCDDKRGSCSKSPIALIISCCILGIVSIAIPANNTGAERFSLDDNSIPNAEMQSETLLSINSDAVLNAVPGKVSFSYPDFVINDATSKTQWLKQNKDGSLSAKGTTNDIMAWKNSNEERCLALTLCCHDKVDNIKILHALPIIVTSNTHIKVDGNQTDFDDFDSIAMDLYEMEIGCDFIIDSNCLYAKEINVSNSNKSYDDVAIINYFFYDKYLDAIENDQPYLTIKDGEVKELQAHLVSMTEPEDYASYCTFQFYDSLGGAPLIHSINIGCSENLMEYPEDSSSLSSIKVTMDDGELVLVE